MLVSYGAVDPAFSDRIRFPLFYRTVPSETAQYQVIIQLIKAFNWNWVGMISSDDETHQKASEEMKDEIIKNGICVAFLVQIDEKNYRSFDFALQNIKKSKVYVVILISKLITLLMIGAVFPYTKVVWLMLSSLASATGVGSHKFNGALAVLFHKGNIPGLKDFLYKADPSRFPKDPFTAAVWLDVFDCHSEQAFPKPSSRSYRICNANHTLKQYEMNGYDTSNFRLTYSTYIAVYAVAHALHAMYTDKTSGGTILHFHKTINPLKPTQV
eukprot:XP_017952029.1 PREDICTED: extracellular calcium-sensing receptor-like isoform X1 [Xenopus tropicalis]